MSRTADWRPLFESFGMVAYGVDGFIPATAHDLEKLRVRCGASTLPPLFVEITTSLGNLAFEESVYTSSLGGERFSIEAFYGGGSSSDGSLIWVHEMFVENSGFPSYWVPFAHDPGGQDYVFDSRDILARVCINIDKLIPVANSFDEFIMGLRVDSDG